MAEPLKSVNHVEIFCSYAHEDEELREDFVSSVALLRQQKLVEVWHDKEIPAGKNWAGEIDEHLNTADIVVLLISRHFLNSDFCYAKEVSRALEREQKKEAVVVPIIVRACDWEEAPFGRLQGIPLGGKAVTSWENREEAWTSVAKSVKLIVRDVLSKKLAYLALKDAEEAREIYAQITADASRMQEERTRIMAEMQSKILAITQDISINRPRGKRADDSFNNMDAYIKQ